MKTRERGPTGGSSPRRGDRERKVPSRYSEFLVTPQPPDTVQVAQKVHLDALYADKASPWQQSAPSNGASSNSWTPSVQDSSEPEEETSIAAGETEGDSHPSSRRAKRSRGGPRKEKLTAWLENALKQGTQGGGITRRKCGAQKSKGRRRRRKHSVGKYKMDLSDGPTSNTRKGPLHVNKNNPGTKTVDNHPEKTARNCFKKSPQDGQSVSSEAVQSVQSWQAFKRPERTQQEMRKTRLDVEEHERTNEDFSDSEGSVLNENNILDVGGESCILNNTSISQKSLSDASMDKTSHHYSQRKQICKRITPSDTANREASHLVEEPNTDVDACSPEPQEPPSDDQDEESSHESDSDSQSNGEDNTSSLTPRTPKRTAPLKRRRTASDLSQVSSWIEEFKKQIKTMDCEKGQTEVRLVDELFKLHPELQDLSKTVDDEPVNKAVCSVRGRQARGDSGHDPQGHRKLPVLSETGHRNGNNLHPWLQKVASEAASMPREEQLTHWQGAQKRVLAKILTSLPHQFGRLLNKYEREQEDRVRLTSNVSYMVPSESQQFNLPNFAPLPHTAIQPPNLKEVRTAAVMKALEVVKYQEVAVVILPIREDSHVKEYLLTPSKRQSIVESTSGAIMTTKKGMEELVGNLHDRALVCFHYNRGLAGELQPCLPHFNAYRSEEKAPGKRLGPGIHESDVQIAIIVRKGIGGTCPLRSAARNLENNGILSVLLGTVPQIPPAPKKTQQRGSFKFPTAVERPCYETNAKNGMTAVPYRMVEPISKSKGIPSVPPTDTASLGEWLDSIRATARCILGSDTSHQMQIEEVKDLQEQDVGAVAQEPYQQVPGGAANKKSCDFDEDDSADHQADEKMNLAQEVDDNDMNIDQTDKSSQKDQNQDCIAEQNRNTPEKVQGGSNDDPQKSLQDLLDVDEAGDEVDELINEMKLCEDGSSGDSVSVMAMSKLHLYTLSCRLEMFVAQETWKEASRDEKDSLFSIIRGIEAWLASRIKEWNSSRLKDFSECLVAAADLDPCLSEQDPDVPVKEKYSCSKNPAARKSTATNESACTQRKNCTSDADGLADICNSLIDIVCSSEEQNHAGENENDVEPREEGQANKNEGEDNSDMKEDQEMIAVHGHSEGPQNEYDFPTEVVKLTASAACLGSMHNFSISDLPWPYYFISTRDCFTYELVPIKTKIYANGRSYVKTEYYFQPNELPDNYHQVVSKSTATQLSYKEAAKSIDTDFQTPKRMRVKISPKGHFETPTSILDDACFNSSVRGTSSVHPSPNTGSTAAAGEECTPVRKLKSATRTSDNEIPQGSFPVGVTTYTEIFTHEELNAIEAMADAVQEMAHNNDLPEECFHETIGRGGNLKRTKYFFGARYMWTRDQMSDPNSKRAGGVRLDVPACPKWMETLIEKPLVDSEIVPEGFINSWALNMYHDGSEGIQSHFDDSVRFLRPIYSLRLFSDSRLSFGTQLYGYTNGAFYIPMPRGCITIMEEGSFAADGVKHCVRPMDMQGKNAGLIMRQINPHAMLEAWKYHLEESTLWLKSLSLEEDATPFKERLNRLIREDGYGKPLDDGAIENICRRVLYRCIREVEKAERDTSSEVRSIVEGLMRGVVRAIHQDDILLKRQVRQEQIMVKHVLDSIVRKIEHQVRSEHRQARQQQMLDAQVRSVIESMIRQLERTDAESRKRRLQATIRGERRKRIFTESLMVARSRDNKDAKRVLKTVNEIVKEVAKGQPGMLQAAQELLHKFGISWVRALKQKQDHDAVSIDPQPQSTWDNAAIHSSQFASPNKASKQSSSHPIFNIPPVISTAAPRDQKSGQGKLKEPGNTFIRNDPFSYPKSVLRYIPANLSLKKVSPQNPESTKLIVEGSSEVKVKCSSPITEATQTNASELHQTRGDFQTSGTKTPAEEIKEEICSKKDHLDSTAPSCKPDEGIGGDHPNSNGAIIAEDQRIIKEKSLVRDLMTTVLKAVVPLAVSAGTGDEFTSDGVKIEKLTTEDVLAAAEKLLANMDAQDQNPPVAADAAPTVILADTVIKGLEEGKRRYNLVPGCVCYECEQQGVDPAQPPRGRSAPLPSDETLLWQCRGKCRKSFHFKCKPPPDDSAKGQCENCLSENHCCLICGKDGNGEAGAVVKCSMGVCGKFYHPQCVLSNPLTNVLQGTWIPVGSVEGDKTGMRFRCPQHYCRTCGLSGANIYSVTCIRCPYAYHSRCCPPGCKRLSKKLVLCAEHEPKRSTS